MTPKPKDCGSATEKLVLPLDQWPDTDRQRWIIAVSPTDPFADEGGDRALMRAHSNRRLQSSYGRWLGFLKRSCEMEQTVDPALRIHLETVQGYVAELQGAGNRSSTIALRLTDLLLMARLFAPNQDWRFIASLARKISANPEKGRDKRLLLRGSDELYGLGEELMADAAQQTSPAKAAILFRDGLIIATLALMPLRRKNFVQLQIGKELVQNGQGWIVDIPGTSTKTHNPLDFDWPAELAVPLETYLQVHRPVLAARCYRWLGRAGTYLWVAATGSALTEMAFYDIVKKRTKSAFGIAINPHAFRDAAATTLAIHDPEHVRVAASVLGHASFKTTEKFYNQARGLDAHRSYVETLSHLRQLNRKPSP